MKYIEPTKPLPRLLKETTEYRVVAKPYAIKEKDKIIKYIDQLVIEKRNRNALNEPYFSEVEYDSYPQGYEGPYSSYYNKYLWNILKDILLPKENI